MLERTPADFINEPFKCFIKAEYATITQSPSHHANEFLRVHLTQFCSFLFVATDCMSCLKIFVKPLANILRAHPSLKSSAEFS